MTSSYYKQTKRKIVYTSIINLQTEKVMITSQNSTNHRSLTNQQTYLIPTMHSRMISGVRCEVAANCTLLRCQTASSFSYLPTFRGAPYWSHLQRSILTLNMTRTDCPETTVTTNQRWVTSQKSKDISHGLWNFSSQAILFPFDSSHTNVA